MTLPEARTLIFKVQIPEESKVLCGNFLCAHKLYIVSGVRAHLSIHRMCF